MDEAARVLPWRKKPRKKTKELSCDGSVQDCLVQNEQSDHAFNDKHRDHDHGQQSQEPHITSLDSPLNTQNAGLIRSFPAQNLEVVQSVLHPDLRSLPGDDVSSDTLDTEMARSPITQSQQQPRPGRPTVVEMLRQLRVDTEPSNTSKGRKQLVNKLTIAIEADLLAHDNEQAATMQRMAGYWRYANKRTYNFMVRNSEIWDW